MTISVDMLDTGIDVPEVSNLELPEFWKRLACHADFYGSLPLMPDAIELFEAVRQLGPIILTGLPRGKRAARRGAVGGRAL